MGTTQVNLHEAKTHLSKLIAALDVGDEVVIANRGTSVARLVSARTWPAFRRPLGSLDLGAPLGDDFDRAMAAPESDAALDEVGWPH